MVFSTTEFLFLFFPLVFLLYYNPFFRGRKFRNYILLFASLGFYAWGEPLFVFVMVVSIVINWYFALLIDRQGDDKKRKQVLYFPIVFDVLLIFIFKYLAFFAQSVGLLLNQNIDLNIALPIGISFFTFQIMSYVFDVYYRKAGVQRSLANVALYISLFPQLVAGPIVRYKTVADEIEGRVETRADITKGITRFVYGLGKKVLVANYLAIVADSIFGITSSMSIGTAWLGIVSYALQIYFDFSGYSDMAIGLGLVFGFHFEENFRYPYAAHSVTDFWRRWHISLSTWFRDYIYIPLGGNRVSKYRWTLNLLVVWTLTGTWHGANWTFIAWGLYYFIFLWGEKMLGVGEKRRWYSHIYTMVVVLVGWVLFRSDSFQNALRYTGFLFGIGAEAFADKTFLYYLEGSKWVLLAAALLALPTIDSFKRLALQNQTLENSAKDGLDRQGAYLIAETLALVVVFVLSILVTINTTYNPFIYFNF